MPAVTEPGDQTSDLLAARRAKLERLRGEGVDPFPHAFAGVTPVASVRERFSELADGEDTEDRVRIAGRLAARRGQGKMAFLDLVDRSGRLQLQAKADVLEPVAFERLLSLDLGDLIGVDGAVFRSRRGELSVRVEGFTVLAKSLRPPPEKHHGLQDVETRHRRRELDLMANEETRERFVTRARVVAAVRRHLDEEGFLEVETPVLQPVYGGALARPFTTHHNALDRTLYLRIATELYLKRLIVGGLERVYELGKDFRNEGLSPKHNPEFTMLELYEAYADYEDVARRLEAVVAAAADAVGTPGGGEGSGSGRSGGEGPAGQTLGGEGYAPTPDFSTPWRRVTLRDAILERTGLDVLALRDRDALLAGIDGHGLDLPRDRTWAQLVDDLLSKYVEPTLIEPTFVTDYPVELSPFAKAHRSEPGLVERWEAFCQGIEIANAFSELNDPDEQRARFDAQAAARRAGDEEAQPYDELFVQALEHGMPPTGGVGLGIDRLVMVLTGTRSIREVVLFPAMRESRSHTAAP
ncbi:lysine--tRNA ligase [soil metagenome]